jgi:hypothetical protein
LHKKFLFYFSLKSTFPHISPCVPKFPLSYLVFSPIPLIKGCLLTSFYVRAGLRVFLVRLGLVDSNSILCTTHSLKL